ncbi:hypothetical protein TWF696_001902 [Orbilia brochopaga]|uniref:Uncharacterized protein n=1 Tax=Orbilia brochopaga TaxID=3140254 RepID=A0AAV9U8G0_9PEZI
MGWAARGFDLLYQAGQLYDGDDDGDDENDEETQAADGDDDGAENAVEDEGENDDVGGVDDGAGDENEVVMETEAPRDEESGDDSLGMGNPDRSCRRRRRRRRRRELQSLPLLLTNRHLVGRPGTLGEARVVRASEDRTPSATEISYKTPSGGSRSPISAAWRPRRGGCEAHLRVDV